MDGVERPQLGRIEKTSRVEHRAAHVHEEETIERLESARQRGSLGSTHRPHDLRPSELSRGASWIVTQERPERGRLGLVYHRLDDR